jgi:DNA-binding NtrC family response regulator
MKCLIVEDDVPLRTFLQSCLEDMGHKVTSRGDKASALLAARTAKYDLLICDYHLPDGEALPVIEYFAATQPNSRVILLTGSGVFPRGEMAVIAPAIDWTLRKPVEVGDLCAIVDYAARDQQRVRPRVQRLG